MQPEKYSLTWHTYSDHLKNMMRELMMNEDFNDVTLVTEDKKHIKANINILSACSPVFKDILKKEKNSNQIMYLRGVQFSEMESIMQFIYLGEATFYKERVDEVLAVAKSLEIKELCNADPEKTDVPKEEPLMSETNDDLNYEPSLDPETYNKNLEEQTVMSDHIRMQTPKERKKRDVGDNGRYDCDQCHKTYSEKKGLHRHKQTVHQGVMYPCDQCDYQAKQQSNLTVHIQSKHEGIKYVCDLCDYQATQQRHLKEHFQAKHEGIKYNCDQCNFTTSWKRWLYSHKCVNYQKLK